MIAAATNRRLHRLLTMRGLPLPATRLAPGLLLRAWLSAGLLALAAPWAEATSSASTDPGIDWVDLGTFSIARTETTIGQFRRFAKATGNATQAERNGGGEVYEAGWVRKPGWTWAAPFGRGGVPDDREPAVHLTFHEAQAFCRWAGGRLPTDAQWVLAAYTEQRAQPPAPFVRGRTYPYPTGESPAGAQCLDDCGAAARERAIRHGAALSRGHGHARTGVTPAGVNGLHDMGGNAWEWVDEPVGATGDTARRTRGGSWWYGAGPMQAGHLQDKPASTAVVYIGFRCVRP
jgi:formylglycine-generating enzyme required for sulfatase activity